MCSNRILTSSSESGTEDEDDAVFHAPTKELNDNSFVSTSKILNSNPTNTISTNNLSFIENESINHNLDDRRAWDHFMSRDSLSINNDIDIPIVNSNIDINNIVDNNDCNNNIQEPIIHPAVHGMDSVRGTVAPNTSVIVDGVRYYTASSLSRLMCPVSALNLWNLSKLTHIRRQNHNLFIDNVARWATGIIHEIKGYKSFDDELVVLADRNLPSIQDIRGSLTRDIPEMDALLHALSDHIPVGDRRFYGTFLPRHDIPVQGVNPDYQDLVASNLNSSKRSSYSDIPNISGAVFSRSKKSKLASDRVNTKVVKSKPALSKLMDKKVKSKPSASLGKAPNLDSFKIPKISIKKDHDKLTVESKSHVKVSDSTSNKTKKIQNKNSKHPKSR